MENLIKKKSVMYTMMLQPSTYNTSDSFPSHESILSRLTFSLDQIALEDSVGNGHARVPLKRAGSVCYFPIMNCAFFTAFLLNRKPFLCVTNPETSGVTSNQLDNVLRSV